MASHSCTPLSPNEGMIKIDPVMVQALLDGLDFISLTYKWDYAAFAYRYLMREPKGVRSRVIYERYTALGGDPTYIRGQLYVSRLFPGELPHHLNSREMIPDSDDEGLDGMRDDPPSGGDDGPRGAGPGSACI